MPLARRPGFFVQPCTRETATTWGTRLILKVTYRRDGRFVTQLESTLLDGIVGAVIAAVVSILTTRYTLRHGPNYEGQIKGLQEAMGSLARTQEEFRLQQVERDRREDQRHEVREKREEAARWKPMATIECKLDGREYVNRLVVKSSDSFRLLEVSLISPTGAKLLDYPRNDDWVDSKGFGFTISSTSLNKLADISPTFFMHETFEGAIRFVAQRASDGAQYTGQIPIHGSRAYVQNVCSLKISG